MRGSVLPYALSVHGFIDKIGDDVGFASIIGVALLVILVFVQARETALLRDRAQDAENRLQQLEQHAAQVSRQVAQAQQTAQAANARSGQAPAPAAPGQVRSLAAQAATTRAATTTRPVAAPFAPFGVGAPALSSATRLIPRPDLPVASAPALAAVSPAAEPAPASAPALAPAPASAPAVARAPAPSTVAAGSTLPPAAPAAPAAPVAPVAPAVPAVPAAPVVPVPAPTIGGAGAGAGAGAVRAQTPAPARAPRRDYGPGDDSGPRVGKGSLAIAGVLIAVIVVAAVLVITHHSSSSTPSSSAHVSTTTGAKASKKGRSSKASNVKVNPTHVRVAVLNGTPTDNLAADVSADLNKVGFQQGETANYADQTQAATTVGYLPGDRAQALAVAQALGISSSSVAQVSTTARQIVCPAGAASCADQIVVTVGADLNSDA